MNEQTGRIEGHQDGRVVVHHANGVTTVALDPERDIRIGFAGVPTSAAISKAARVTGWIQLRRDDARGWEVTLWGMTPAITAACGGETVRIEFDPTSWHVDIGEPFDGHYAIRKTRGQLAKCAEFLTIWRDGGRPVARLLAELPVPASVEGKPDASFRELIATYMAGDATAVETVDAIAEQLGGVDP